MAGMAEDDGRLWKGFEGGRAVREGHGCISLPVRQTPPLFARSLAAGLIPPSSLPLFSARTEHSLFDFLFPRLSDHHPPQPARHPHQSDTMPSDKDYASAPTAEEEKRGQMLEVELQEDADALPSPVSAATPRPAAKKLTAAAIIPVWICLSSAVIIYNNYLYNTLEFKFPVFLVTWHLTFAVRTEAFPPLLVTLMSP